MRVCVDGHPRPKHPQPPTDLSSPEILRQVLHQAGAPRRRSVHRQDRPVDRGQLRPGGHERLPRVPDLRPVAGQEGDQEDHGGKEACAGRHHMRAQRRMQVSMQ